MVMGRMQDKCLADEAERHWEQIASRRYMFRAREDEVADIRQATLAQVQVRR